MTQHFIRVSPRAESIAGLGRRWLWTCTPCRVEGREMRREDRDEAIRRHERGQG